MELPAWKVEERERGMIDLEEEVVHITLALLSSMFHRMRGTV